jgi:hypothetical protein
MSEYDASPSVPDISLIARSSDRVRWGTVEDLFESGDVGVRPDDATAGILCDVLQTSDAPALSLEPGDQVLVLLPNAPDGRGCVLGRIGPYRAPETERVTIEADKELTLRCGKARLTLRHDGKVLTRATDIASLARRRQRIKGGSVEIN